MAQSTRRLPTNSESMRTLLIGLMEQSLDSMERLRDREWLLRQIDHFKNPKQLSGQVRHIKPTGMIRRLDSLGRAVLPMELRRTLSISPRTPLEIYTEGEWIVLEKADVASKCAACGSQEDLSQFKSIYLCESCIGELFDTVEIGGE